MDWSGKLICVLLVAIVCVSAAIAITYNPAYSITYEPNGGEVPSDAPTSFKTGDYVILPVPTNGDLLFSGWYTDPEFETQFKGDTTGINFSLTLYALWSTDLSGHSLTLTKSGYYNNGMDPFNSYTISGTLTVTYLYYSEEKGTYFIDNTDVNNYTYPVTGTSHSSVSSSQYWGGEEIERAVVDTGTETVIVTIGGKQCEKECTWFKYYYFGSGMYETQWIADEWIMYKAVVEYTYSLYGLYTVDYRVEYAYLSDDIVEVSDFDITVMEGKGIETEGAGSYKPGETATLTATVDEDVQFAGWFDSNLNLLSRDMVYTMEVGGSQTIYAMNMSEMDASFEADTQVDLNIEGYENVVSYTITNLDTDETEEVMDSIYTFADAGPYSITVTMGGDVCKYYVVKVSGDVTRTFQITYDDASYTLSLEIDYDDVLYAKNLYTQQQRQHDSKGDRDLTFVTFSYTDERMSKYMESLVGQFVKIIDDNGMSMDKALGLMLRFTQEIEYQTDSEHMGVEEYWKFPIETLYDMGGDCEDTSILFCAIIHQVNVIKNYGYSTAMLLLPGHMAGAVKINEGSKWSYCETTVVGYDVGKIPETMKRYIESNNYQIQQIP